MPTRLDLHAEGFHTSGIDITYYKTKRELVIGGWYDSFVGIESHQMTLGAFLNALGITLKDCEKALKTEQGGHK